MKTAISVPDEVFRQAEQAAKRLGVSRSELFTRAVRAYLGVQRDSTVTASYDAAFADSDEEETAAFRREAARRALLSVEWKEG
jgi:predicted transcriptional regulator